MSDLSRSRVLAGQALVEMCSKDTVSEGVAQESEQTALHARTEQQRRILTFQASSKERIAALNLNNTPSADGFVHGRVLPVGCKQSWGSWTLAISTLCLFVSWPYFMAFLSFMSALVHPSITASFVVRSARTCVDAHSPVSSPDGFHANK